MITLIEVARREKFCEVALVLANRPGAPGLSLANEIGIEAIVLDHTRFSSRDSFDEALDSELRARRVDIVTLAGFMRILTPGFTLRWQGRLINIHPSLLPAFPGIRVHEEALAAGAAISGCTVHLVVPELGAGAMIGQATVPVQTGDTPETLAARVLEAEHKLYPLCLRMICEGRVRLNNGRAVFASGGPILLTQPSN